MKNLFINSNNAIEKAINVLEYKEGHKSSIECECVRCGGTGVTIFEHIENGVCFKCKGSGKITKSTKLYTLDEANKVIQKRKEKLEEKNLREMHKREKVSIEKFVIKHNLNGYKLYVSTIEDRDLKWLGAYIYISNINLEDTIEIDIRDFWDYTELDILNLQSYINNSIEEKNNKLYNYIGEEKEKVELKVRLIDIKGYSTQFGHTNVYIMQDVNSMNICVWKTTKDIDNSIEDEFIIRGTIKENIKYDLKKQSVLTRCKII